ncbi:RNA 2',3'-cyclic phosphodiesterase [Dietzia sp. 179-F 9C3 NHS]|uniref:RNA 2',3'-cyclic phosphodiesterase n=1 Tax=Dietzia sp. 179-F 9C3 NHS TaxID=3374295 RepID=UPI003879F213
MGHRMFVAVLPPEEVRDELERFLEPRPGLTWTAPSQWHLTLAFCPDVDEWRIEEFADRLAAAARRHEPFRLRLAGAGAFPSVDRPRVLWAGVRGAGDDDEVGRLRALATSTRNAANAVGGAPDGARFRPHLTLARLRGNTDATRWLRVLETFASSPWSVEEIALVDSFLGEARGGRARHEVVARLPLGPGD